MARKNSYAEQINDTKVMLAGLNAQLERLAKRGITTETIAELQNIYDEVRNIDNEQEALKARLKEITELLTRRLKEMRDRYNVAKKIVKLELPKESWKEFGIKDKR